MFCWTLLVVVFYCSRLSILNAADGDSAKMKIINLSGAPIELYWINHYEILPNNELNLDKSLNDPIRNGTEVEIHSYDTHQFLVRFQGYKKGDTQARFTKGPEFEYVHVRFDKATGLFVEVSTKADQLQTEIEDFIDICQNTVEEGMPITDCLTEALATKIHDLQAHKHSLQKFHYRSAERMRNYTCADEKLKSSKPIGTMKHTDDDGVSYTSNILFEAPSAKIWYIENFVSDDECDILMKHGAPRLKRATVAAEDGTSIVSENRKAQQALYRFKEDMDSDPLGPLYLRIIGLTNAHTGYDLSHEGQEQFTIIQYNPTDQYMAHCDGACDGEKYISAGRVATSVLYCKVPIRGGAITFSRADIYFKPSNGTAVFFAYKGADDHMDDGFTEHSSCPVIEGEKWATTAWMRQGVTAERNWELFDPQGVPILDTSAMEEESADEILSSTNEETTIVNDETK